MVNTYTSNNLVIYLNLNMYFSLSICAFSNRVYAIFNKFCFTIKDTINSVVYRNNGACSNT
ncbi:Uncharacterised protein [Mycobacteroides abscessus subsp. abscessus]|nr:Uncharacterised protein [Mycobacteroides abscessus subsp. abscessus]